MILTRDNVVELSSHHTILLIWNQFTGYNKPIAAYYSELSVHEIKESHIIASPLHDHFMSRPRQDGQEQRLLIINGMWRTKPHRSSCSGMTRDGDIKWSNVRQRQSTQQRFRQDQKPRKERKRGYCTL